MNKTVMTALAAAAMAVAMPTLAQTAAPATAEQGLTEADIQILRADLKADKRKTTAETLSLTEAEAAKFWPVYDRHAADLSRINDRKYALIKEYTDKFGTYSDAKATDFTTRWLAVDVDAAKLRASYVPIVGKVLPGVKSASFFQIDRRLNMLVNLGLASQLPIMQMQDAK